MATKHEDPPPQAKGKRPDTMHRIVVTQTQAMTDEGIDKVQDFLDRGFVEEKLIGTTRHVLVKPMEDVQADRNARDEQYVDMMKPQKRIGEDGNPIVEKVEEVAYTQEQIIEMAKGGRAPDND